MGPDDEEDDPNGADRFSWGGGDLVYYDEDGTEMTPRQVLEAQLYAYRAMVEDQSAYPGSSDPEDPSLP